MGVMLLWSIRSNNLPLTVLKGCNVGNRSRVLLLKNGRRLIGKRQIRPASCSTTYGGRAGRLAPGGAPSPRAGFHSFGSRRGPGKGLLRLNIQERLIPLPRIGRHGRDKIVRSTDSAPMVPLAANLFPLTSYPWAISSRLATGPCTPPRVPCAPSGVSSRHTDIPYILPFVRKG
jgi:hypothetical protein